MQLAESQELAAKRHLKKTCQAKMLRIFNIPMCGDCSKDANIFCFFALCDFAMLITIGPLLGLQTWRGISSPVTPRIDVIMLAILAAHYAVASCGAMACAYRGYVTAIAGHHNHAHVADMLRWHGTFLRDRLTYWLAYSLWLARLMAWYYLEVEEEILELVGGTLIGRVI